MNRRSSIASRRNPRSSTPNCSAKRHHAFQSAIETLETRQLLSSVSLVVTNTNDSGAGSLRSAIAAANFNTTPSDTVTIGFANSLVGQTIQLASTLELSNTTAGVTIVIDASNVPGLAVKGGGSDPIYFGGYSSGGTLTAHLSDNSATDYVLNLSSSSHYTDVVAITYEAASANQTLTISWVKSQTIAAASGSVDLISAWLT
jgi:hypothetical protein